MKHTINTTKKNYGLTDNEVYEALELRNKKIQEEVIVELIGEFPSLYNALSTNAELVDVLNRAIALSTTKGFEMATDLEGIAEEYLDDLNYKTTPTTEYTMEVDKGISGVLLPNGTFIMCIDKEHAIAVAKHDSEVVSNCVYFSSVFDGKSGFVSISPYRKKPITKQQIEWVDKNIEYFDDNQRGTWIRLLNQGVDL